ncbi:hypothetical protein [Micromonospora maritima]|uniref:hypothetical protein n=1 Tax=Micromonospora maritima TaxID=986711 RepID=UPI00157C584E|nr:hypothetical protein [Micromonospora maritima]
MTTLPTEPVVLAIVGSTTFVDLSALAAAEEIIEGVFARRRPDLVVSGGAEGIDSLGVALAKKHGIPHREHLPTVRQWNGPGGFQERNLLIAGECTRILRIACRWSKTYGSGWTTDQAEKQGALAWRVTLPRTVEAGALWVPMGRATVGVEVRDGRVVAAPPYARKLGWIGRDVDGLVKELQAKRVGVRWLPGASSEDEIE